MSPLLGDNSCAEHTYNGTCHRVLSADTPAFTGGGNTSLHLWGRLIHTCTIPTLALSKPVPGSLWLGVTSKFLSSERLAKLVPASSPAIPCLFFPPSVLLLWQYQVVHGCPDTPESFSFLSLLYSTAPA